MCGIFGALRLGKEGRAVREPLERMAEALHHRGPDDTRIVHSPRFALGATRLRVVDLSERADQPLLGPAQQHWLACNGEIYNAAELRRRYRDYPFRSNSDIEPLLPLLAAR